MSVDMNAYLCGKRITMSLSKKDLFEFVYGFLNKAFIVISMFDIIGKANVVFNFFIYDYQISNIIIDKISKIIVN